MNEKKILTLCLVACLAITAIAGASLAYFTDTKSATNTFTVGNVKIELLESKYHREGNDNSGDASIPDPDKIASGMKYVTDGHKIFTDAEIEEDAATYQDNYLKISGSNLVPGKNAAKCVYVKNTGKNDAYIRIRVMIPSAANNDFVAAENGGVIANQWCGTALKVGEFVHGVDLLNSGNDNIWPVITKGVDKDGVRYDVYTFTRTEPLKAGAMTEWNVWNFIGIAKEATSDSIDKAIESGVITENEDGTLSLNVLVEADAIQSEGFTDTKDKDGSITAIARDNAWAAFDKA